MEKCRQQLTPLIRGTILEELSQTSLFLFCAVHFLSIFLGNNNIDEGVQII